MKKVNKVHNIFRKTSKKSSPSSLWKKKSIFFDLPYWSKVKVRHCIDVMHVEKNVCDSLIGTLLNIHEMTKNGVNYRSDFVEMKIREDLAPKDVGKTYLFSLYMLYYVQKSEDNFLLLFKECQSTSRIPFKYAG